MKKRIIAIALFAALLVGGMHVFGLTDQFVDYNSGWYQLYHYIQSSFTEGKKGTGLYGTDTERVVKQCYVRLREGDYDSYRQYSDVGSRYGSRGIESPYLDKWNNIFRTCYTNYGWEYYNY